MVIEYKRIFIDTAPIIYLLEKNPTYYERALEFFQSCFKQKKELITSAITVTEYCVFPLRNNQNKLIENFDCFLSQADMKVIPIDYVIAKKASEIRANYINFKAMDCLQLATASLLACDMFLTNDKQLMNYKELIVKTFIDEIF